MIEVFESDELMDWFELHKAIDEASEDIPCTNFPDVFFPDKGAFLDAQMAKAMCQNCPVIRECGSYAMKWEPDGIWGGITSRHRQTMKYRRAA